MNKNNILLKKHTDVLDNYFTFFIIFFGYFRAKRWTTKLIVRRFRLIDADHLTLSYITQRSLGPSQ